MHPENLTELILSKNNEKIENIPGYEEKVTL